ncbi:MAG: oxalurate catabolism protein HpxZ [Ferrimicrobium sp.]
MITSTVLHGRQTELAVDDDGVLAELGEVFHRYEQALVGNDIATLDELFWQDALTVRFGAGEELYGHAEIAIFRRDRPGVGLARTVLRAEVHTFGTDFAVTSLVFTREGISGVGRQSQTWVRFDCGWRVVAAHVSQRGG